MHYHQHRHDSFLPDRCLRLVVAVVAVGIVRGRRRRCTHLCGTHIWGTKILHTKFRARLSNTTKTLSFKITSLATRNYLYFFLSKHPRKCTFVRVNFQKNPEKNSPSSRSKKVIINAKNSAPLLLLVILVGGLKIKVDVGEAKEKRFSRPTDARK